MCKNGELHCAPFLCRKRVEEEEMGVLTARPEPQAILKEKG